MAQPTRLALRLLFDEARHVLEVQTQGIEALDQKAGTLLRFNVLLLGVLGTGASLAVRSGLDPSTLPIVAAGFLGSVGAFLGSALSTSVAYRAIRWDFGVRGESLEGSLRFDATEREVLQASLLAYTSALGLNSAVADRALLWLDRALWARMMGLVLLSGTALRLWWMGFQ